MGKSVVVIPVHNEASTIASVVVAARAYLPVIVVDDASDDGSGQLAAASGAMVLTLPRQRGKGAALRHGFVEALRQGADTVVTLDGDGQHDPRDIPRLLAASQRDPESLIIGGRLGSAETIPLARLYAIEVVSFWINWLGQCTVRDTQSGLRLYPAAVLRTLPLRHGGFLFESAILLKASQTGWRVCEIPIHAVYPPGRASQYRPLRDSIPIIVPGHTFLAHPALARMPCLAYRAQGNPSPHLAAYVRGGAGHGAIAAPRAGYTRPSLYGAHGECVALRCHPAVLRSMPLGQYTGSDKGIP